MKIALSTPRKPGVERVGQSAHEVDKRGTSTLSGRKYAGIGKTF